MGTERHVHLVSGGVGSWLAAKIDMAANPGAQHIFSFTDVLYEDADCYRFLIEGVGNLLGKPRPNWLPSAEGFPDYRVSEDTPIENYAGNLAWRAFLAELRDMTAFWLPQLHWLVEGRDPWEVYRDERFLGNSSADPCSRVLKRRIRDRWIEANFDRSDTVIIVGIGSDERHRFNDGKGGGFQPRLAEAGWKASAPLIGMIEAEWPFGHLQRAGIERPRLYRMGYIHNNCGGFCCKAGQAHYVNRRRVQPERFAYDAMMERKVRAYLDADVSMLTDRVGGNGKKPLTLDAFALRLTNNPQIEIDYSGDDSGCGCMIDEAAA